MSNMLNNPLNDTVFLDKLFSINEREIYIRITALTFNELPIECIEGRAIDGSINIDGSSAVRRTCNITLVAENVNINEFYWGLKNKFKLEVGLKNEINSFYPEIIWFKQGIFVITQFNTTQTTNKWTIKIQGKDKMCLLNGNVSGNLPANVDFGHEEYYNTVTKTSTLKEVPIKTIILKAVQEFGGELLHNIIIKDIDENGQELLEYRGLTPLYIFKNVDTEEFIQISINSNLKCYYKLNKKLTLAKYNLIPSEYDFLLNIYERDAQGNYVFNEIKANQNEDYKKRIHGEDWFEGKISDNFNIFYDDLLDDEDFVGNDESTLIKLHLDKDEQYVIIKINTGEIPGYRITDLTFGGELKAKIGETLTSVLDKIKNKFTNFEYFYDVDGKFIFQKKREYLVTNWNPDNSTVSLFYNGNNIESDILFKFSDNKLITSFQNSPKITEIKNDYSVWGTRDKTAIHMRYAIDNKPTSYTPIRPLKEKIVEIYWDANGNIIKEKNSIKYYDAPEIQPYNELGLISNDEGYRFLEAIKGIPEKTFAYGEYLHIQELLSMNPNTEQTQKWIDLFKKKENQYLYQFKGNYDDIKEIFITLNKSNLIYNNEVQMSFIPLEDGGEKWTAIYAYYANYPYSVEDIYDEEGKLIHYKVDWRELIYQMALDYRKLNYTDNYLYYLTLKNPDLVYNNKTGYEQYYIDLEGFWRYLYNPNPDLIFENIDYKTVQKETLLEDGNLLNDNLDMIYIKNGYKVLNSDDIENLTYSDIYKYSRAENGEINSIYPFITSDTHHLTTKYYYYIEEPSNNPEKETEMVAYFCDENSDSDSNYIKLNNVTLDKIYVKNDQPFKSKSGFSYKNFMTTPTGTEFRVPYYPSVSNLDTYADRAISDYLSYVNLQFNNLKENLNSSYYIQENSNCLKLSDFISNNQLWDLYYQSDIYPLSYYIRDIVYALTILNENKKKNEYEHLYTKYVENIINNLENCNNILLKKDFIEINKIFSKLTINLISSYKTGIINLLTKIKQDYNISDEAPSCLNVLFDHYKTKFNNIKIINNLLIDDQFKQNIYTLKEINLYVQDLINHVKTNYNQIIQILNKSDTILKASSIEKFIEELNFLLDSLNLTTQYYQDGQLQKSIAQIENIIYLVTTNKITLTDGKTSFNENVVYWADILRITLENIDTLLSSEIFILDENKTSSYKTIFNYLTQVSKLYTIFTADKNDLNALLKFNNNILIPNLYNEINQKDANITKVLNSYKNNTKKFQEYFIKENINNFNRLKDNKLIYETIQYQRASYKYKHNKEEGNFWLLDIYSTPQLLLFWFDFMEPANSELIKYAVPAIGTRTKVVNDKDVKAMHYKDIPNIIFRTNAQQHNDILSGYNYINITESFMNLFNISSKGKTAKERIDELVYNHSHCAENINIQVIPIYNLEPNNKIYIRDNKCQIDGNYLINKITIPLNYKKMMTITALKAIDESI